MMVSLLNYNFTHFPMRVRFYNLPFKGWGNEYNVHMLASKIGTLVKIDKEDVVDINRSVGFVLLLISETLKKEC